MRRLIVGALLALLVWRVLATGERRGPAPEARTLYEDLSPQPRDPAADAD